MKLFVRSAPLQFHRSGTKFTRDGHVIETDDYTEDQVQAIIDEPNLHVREATEEEIGPEESGDDDAKGKKAGGKKGGAKES